MRILHIYIFLIILLTICSCSNKSASEQNSIARAESLINNHSGSVLAILDSIDIEQLGPQKAYAYYLKGKAKLDLHNYPQPEMYLYDAQRATVLGEYGGIGLVLKDHIWEPNRNWGYVQFNSSKEVTDEYVKYADMLYQMIKRGFSAAVYTQTTDVEVEVNGLMTYDRKVIKLDEKRVKEINTRICNALKK